MELFDRSGHRPKITSAGASLLADVRALLIKVDAMRARAHGLGKGVELELTLALDPQFPLPVLGCALSALGETYPTVALRILSTPLGAPFEALLARECDLAISGIGLVNPAIELETLMTVRRAAVAAPGHAIARAVDTPLSTSTLADHVQIVGEDSSALTGENDYGVVSPLRWRVADNSTKRTLILSGAGWGTLPLWMIERELSDGDLVRLPVAAFGENGETTVQTFLARRIDRPLGPVGAVFREALLAALPRDDRNAVGGSAASPQALIDRSKRVNSPGISES